ncbi:MAG: tetratricopeptide repeat protein, partial [Nonomuraea sp.]|nr:tetratricopeptide repeat protein [Nonomuraea sp.]
RQAVALLTLTAPTPAELPDLLSAVPSPHTADARRTAIVADWLGRIFPGVDRLCPLGPDLVAEQALAETEDLDALVLAIHDHERRTTGHLVRMLDVLRLCADRDQVGQALRSLVTYRLESLVAEAAANPATRLADLLNAALSLLPETTPLPADRPGAADVRQGLAEAVAGLPVRAEVPLGMRALEVTSGELAVRHLRRIRRRTALAGALSGLSARLAAVGRVGEAVAAATEAVEIFAAAPPYEEAAGRAEALFNLGACLLLAGEAGSALKPAREAAARFRILAEDDPRHTARAARSHHNLACALLEAGRLREAADAFASAGGDPDFTATLTSVLAASIPTPVLDEHPNLPLPDERARTAAEGAGASPVVRAGGRGDRGVRRVAAPVGPLDGLGSGALAEMGACLAVAATDAVTDVAPTDRDLAHRLRLLATWLGGHGRTSEALAPATEAVVRLRDLAGEEPGLRLMHAEAAGLLARLHAELGDLDPAERYATEAVRGLRALVALDPEEHRPALAAQLLDLGELLLTDARPKDALTPLQDATIAATALTKPPPTAGPHVATLARARYLLGLCLDDLGRHADARAQLRTAAELYDRLSSTDPRYARHREEARTNAVAEPATDGGDQLWSPRERRNERRYAGTWRPDGLWWSRSGTGRRCPICGTPSRLMRRARRPASWCSRSWPGCSSCRSWRWNGPGHSTRRTRRASGWWPCTRAWWPSGWNRR